MDCGHYRVELKCYSQNVKNLLLFTRNIYCQLCLFPVTNTNWNLVVLGDWRYIWIVKLCIRKALCTLRWNTDTGSSAIFVPPPPASFTNGYPRLHQSPREVRFSMASLRVKLAKSVGRSALRSEADELFECSSPQLFQILSVTRYFQNV